MNEKWAPKSGGRKARPLRGALWGLMSGLGLALVLITTTTISLAVVPIVAVIVVMMIAGAVWSSLGPPKTV